MAALSPAADPPPDPTLLHILSLPAHLHPISPALSALQLARVRFLLSVPSSAVWGWVCSHCGALRDGIGAGPASKRRKRGTADTQSTGDASRRPAGTAAAGVVAFKQRPVGGLGGKDKSAARQCTYCGTAFKRAKPDPATLASFPAARRTRRSNALQAELPPDPPPATTPPTAGGTPGSYQAKPPTLLSTPSLSYIPHQEPNPPTYPEPERPSLQPKSTAAAARKKKKSGLAKLLAENKERHQAELGGKGMWGLG